MSVDTIIPRSPKLLLSIDQGLDLLQLAVTIALAVFVYWRTKKIDSFKSILTEARQIRSELRGLRDDAHAVIFRLTGALNLYGPEGKLDLDDLSQRMALWYFDKGVVLDDDVQKHYFMIQDVITVCGLFEITPRRPGPDKLYGVVPGGLVTDQTAQARLNDLRGELMASLGVKFVRRKGTRPVTDLKNLVRAWKTGLKPAGDGTASPTPDPEAAWIVLQYLMSQFRTRVKDARQTAQDGT